MKKIVGVIISNPIIKDDFCIYEVQSLNEKYKVISSGYQSVKDKIFINKGQCIEVLGDITDGIMYTKKSRIVLRKVEM